jgi:hypothetical protein
VREELLGRVLPAEDPDALAQALKRALYDAEFAAGCVERIAVVAQRFAWPKALEPLVEFCRDPRPAADRLPGAEDLVVSAPLSGRQVIRRDLALVREYLADGGGKELARRVAGRVRKVARGRG